MTASKSGTGGSTAPTHDRRSPVTERLLTVQEAADVLNTGARLDHYPPVTDGRTRSL
jgi:hypothetical protein